MSHLLSSAGAMTTMAPAPAASATKHWSTEAAWVVAANLSQAAGPFVSLLAISHLHGLDAAGRFAYALALTTPLYLLLSFQLKALLLTHSATEFSTAAAAGIRSFSSVLGVAVVFGLLLLATPLAGILLAARLVESWAELYQTDQQRRQRSWRVALSSILRSMLLLASILCAPSVEEAIALYLLLSFTLLVFLDMDAVRFEVEFESQVLRSFLLRGVLLGGVLFLQSAHANIPRLALDHFGDEASLGIFATLSVLMQTGNLISSSFGQGLVPTLMTASLTRVLGLAALPALAGLLTLGILTALGDFPLSLLGLQGQPNAHGALLALGVAQISVWPAAMIGYALTARRLYRQQIYLSIALNGVSGMGSLLLIPRFGPAGAAFVMGLTAATMLLLSFVLLARSPRGAVQ
ncbi:lipopolysaccharide biosynthesis protein [Bryobacter aggregatus]|uniref:lipopolysaccharide biosynthesis protein n=1 Tax=Bryobacter aggregatus TaxID=360054 RepID=UPI0004E0CAA8|nr:hypothetical protein [Bryobacter aggregatus]